MAISLGDALLKLGIDATGFNKSMDESDQKVKSMTEKWQTGLKVVGGAFTTLGAAGLKFVNDAKEMNAVLDQTAVTLGLTSKQMQDLTLATANAGFPLKDVAGTFEELARAGVKDQEQLVANANAFDALGDATGSTATQMAQALIPAYKAFNLELPKTSEEMDKFTYLARNTTVNISEFSSLLGRVAPDMKKLGLSMDDAAQYVAALAAKGIEGRKATMMFNQAINDITKAEEDNAKAAGEMGGKVAEATKKVSDAQKALTDINIQAELQRQRDKLDLADIERALKGQAASAETVQRAQESLTKAENELSKVRQKASLDLQDIQLKMKKVKPGTIEYQRLLMEQKDIQERVANSQEKVKDAQEALAKSTKTIMPTEAERQRLLLKQKEIQNDLLNIDGKVKDAQDDLADAQKKLTEASNGALKPVHTLAEALGLTGEEVDKVKNAMGNAKGTTEEYAAAAEKHITLMDNLKEAYGEFTLKVGSALEPLEPMLAVVTALGPVMLAFSSAQGIAAAKTAGHTVALIAHGVAMAAVKVATVAWTAAQWLLNIALDANPIGLIIIAVAALIAGIVLLVKNWDKVVEAMQWLWDRIKEIWGAIVEFFSTVWDKIIDIFRSKWGVIIAILFPAVGLPMLIAANWGKIVDVVKDIWNRVTDFISSSNKSNRDTIINIWNSIVAYYTERWNTMLKTTSEILSNIWRYIYNYFNQVEDWFNTIWNRISSFFTNIWNTMWRTASQWLNNIYNTVVNIWTNVTNWLSDKWDEITNIFRNWWSTFTNFLSSLNPWEWIKQGWENLKNGISNVIHEIFGGSIIEDWWTQLTNWLSGLDLYQIGASILGTLKSGFEGIMKTITSSLSSWVTDVLSTLQGLLTSAGNIISQIWDKLRGGGNPPPPTTPTPTPTPTPPPYVNPYPYQPPPPGEYYPPAPPPIYESYATGGLALHPQIASIAEHGPEAVLPLDRLTGLQPVTYVTVNIGDERVAEIVDRALDKRKRIQVVS